MSEVTPEEMDPPFAWERDTDGEGIDEILIADHPTRLATRQRFIVVPTADLDAFIAFVEAIRDEVQKDG